MDSKNVENLVALSLLYDFYGELLTKHQKQVYEDFVLNDYSLSEIADEQGITRQGVHDLIKRCNRSLQEYEDKLHLVERFLNAREKVAKLQECILQIEKEQSLERLSQMKQLSQSILEEF
jgi:hypothetical protein